MLKLTEKGKQLYEATKNFTGADLDVLEVITKNNAREISVVRTDYKEEIKFLREKGLIEGE